MRNSILALLILLVTLSCETDIPATDTTAPTFSLRIKSARFDRTFTQDDDFDNMILRLKNDSGYQFTYTSYDEGGVRLMRWQVPGDDLISFDTDIVSPWTIRNVSSINRMIEWLGNRNDPYTGNILTGKFRATGSNVGGAFTIFVSDFGGDSSNYNNTSAVLNISIGNWEAEVVEN